MRMSCNTHTHTHTHTHTNEITIASSAIRDSSGFVTPVTMPLFCGDLTIIVSSKSQFFLNKTRDKKLNFGNKNSENKCNIVTDDCYVSNVYSLDKEGKAQKSCSF